MNTTTQLTPRDLIELGYYFNLSDMARRAGIARPAVYRWAAARGNMRPESIAKIAKAARKPLKPENIFRKIRKEQREDFITTERAPRLKSTKISEWLMSFAKVKGS